MILARATVVRIEDLIRFSWRRAVAGMTLWVSELTVTYPLEDVWDEAATVGAPREAVGQSLSFELPVVGRWKYCQITPRKADGTLDETYRLAFNRRKLFWWTEVALPEFLAVTVLGWTETNGIFHPTLAGAQQVGVVDSSGIVVPSSAPDVDRVLTTTELNNRILVH